MCTAACIPWVSRATMLTRALARKVARFLNASREQEIIFTRGTTTGLNLVASSYGREVCAGR